MCKWLRLHRVKTARGKSEWQVTQVTRLLNKLNPEQRENLRKHKRKAFQEEQVEDEFDYVAFMAENEPF